MATVTSLPGCGIPIRSDEGILRKDPITPSRARAGLIPVSHLGWQKSCDSNREFIDASDQQVYLLAPGHPAKPRPPAE
jgi:hypothetical protein